MSLTTKREVCQEILYQLYGGMPSNDASISENFVLRLVNDKIAVAAVKSAFGTYNLDGVVAADDIFTLSYSALALTIDTANGLKYFTLPDTPVGLPSNRAFNIYPPNSRGGIQGSIFKPIARGEVTYVRSLPGIRKVWHFVEQGRMYFVDAFNIMATYSSVNASIVTSGANDLTAFLNLPDDMISEIKMAVMMDLRPMIGLTDTTPLPQADAPESRK